MVALILYSIFHDFSTWEYFNLINPFNLLGILVPQKCLSDLLKHSKVGSSCVQHKITLCCRNHQLVATWRHAVHVKRLSLCLMLASDTAAMYRTALFSDRADRTPWNPTNTNLPSSPMGKYDQSTLYLLFVGTQENLSNQRNRD